jgi:hypothetical protein
MMGMYIKKKDFGDLESHDYHVLMQQLLPLTLGGLLTAEPCMVVINFKK